MVQYYGGKNLWRFDVWMRFCHDMMGVKGNFVTGNHPEANPTSASSCFCFCFVPPQCQRWKKRLGNLIPFSVVNIFDDMT